MGMTSTICKTKSPARERQSEGIVARMFWFRKAKIGPQITQITLMAQMMQIWRGAMCNCEFIRRCGDSPLRW